MEQKIPHHIAIVMDGNGRWAESRSLVRLEGHRAGIEAVRTVVECSLKKNIAILSLFAFSSENWLRPAMEVNFLMRLFIITIQQEVSELHANGVCLRFIGDRYQLPRDLCREIEAAEELTRNNNKLRLNIAINYSGRWDIVEAVKKIAALVANGNVSPENIDEDVFARQLTSESLPDPDLLIRTSGEQRISNFFLWQLAYTELYFTNKHWPDFNAEEFQKALTSFSLRERRYGQVFPQIARDNYV